MNRLLSALALTTLIGGNVMAAPSCHVPVADWKPREALKAKLQGEGWAVRTIRAEDGCYEARALTASGREVEAHFDPRSFAPVEGNAKDCPAKAFNH